MIFIICYCCYYYLYYRSLNLYLRLLIGKLVRKMDSNRFISHLMDQKPIHIDIYVIHRDF